MSSHEYKIYRYWSPSGKSYIGQTNQTLNARSGSNGQNYYASTKFFNAIKKYGFEWFKEHREILFDGLFKDEADKLEHDCIIKYDSINNGYNIQTGGSFNINELRAMKPIIGINCQTKKIEYFDSIAEAARQKKLNRRSINKVVNHEKGHKTIGGYVWCSVEEWNSLEDIEKEKLMNTVPVYIMKRSPVICLTTGEKFNSIKEAEKAKHCNNISPCCRGIMHSAGKLPDGTPLKWKYINECGDANVN